MRYLPSKDHGRLNRRTYDPERITHSAMLNPWYPTLTCGDDRQAPWLLWDLATEVVDDSGAFQERDMHARLAPGAALDRQLRHEATLREHVPGFRFSALVTYDMLVGVDEALEPDDKGVLRRVKRRGTHETAMLAVDETKRSADLYHKRRLDIAGAIVYSAQGAEPDQYLDCVEVLLGHVRRGVDWLALGGFCILGKQQSLLPQFIETVNRAVPLAARAGVARVHVLGVAWAPPLEHLAAVCAAHGLDCSTDHASIEVNSIMGKVFDVADMRRPQKGKRRRSPWTKPYGPADKWNSLQRTPPGRYHPAELSLANLKRFNDWCESL